MSSLRRQGIVVAPPVADALTDSQLRAVVAHELAHLRDHDLWLRLLRLLRLFLSLLASAATALALYAVPWLRRLPDLSSATVTAQALPFLLAVGYLAAKVLRAAELRAVRAEEAAADQRAVDMTGDAQAYREAIGMICSMLGTPGTWTLPQRLLTASHPAADERLGLISAGASPASKPAAGVYRPAFASVAAIALAVGAFALGNPLGPPAPPEHLGWYRVVPPSRFDGGVRTGPPGSGTAVWSSGVRRFSGAVPVNVVYDKDGQPWLYMWGAYGDLGDPAGELSAFWQATNPFSALGPPAQIIDSEPTGPLNGYLQCNGAENTCAWADYSGIIVVSQSPPDQDATFAPITTYPGGFYSEQVLAGLTESFRDAAESLQHRVARPDASLPALRTRQRARTQAIPAPPEAAIAPAGPRIPARPPASQGPKPCPLIAPVELPLPGGSGGAFPRHARRAG